MKLGNQLRYLIKSEHITQKLLAEELHISPSTLNGYLKNKRQPDYKTLLRLATYFETTTDYLLGHSSLDNTTVKQLSQSEVELIERYRLLNENGQGLLLEEAELILNYHKKQLSNGLPDHSTHTKA